MNKLWVAFVTIWIAISSITFLFLQNKHNGPNVPKEVMDRIRLEALTQNAEGQLKIITDELARLKVVEATVLGNFKTLADTLNNHRDNFRLIETSINEQSKQIVKLKELMQVVTKGK